MEAWGRGVDAWRDHGDPSIFQGWEQVAFIPSFLCEQFNTQQPLGKAAAMASAAALSLS
jgi:hypothetical protein